MEDFHWAASAWSSNLKQLQKLHDFCDCGPCGQRLYKQHCLFSKDQDQVCFCFESE